MAKKAISQKVMDNRKRKTQGMKSKLHSVANNPFEIRVYRNKSNVLGRKTKEEKGKPGISRSKAIKKRKQTLLQEYKVKNKANIFVDKRFGEFDKDMPVEQKMLRRFALSRQQHHRKAGVYNLDDEDLTHFGQSLANIDDYSDMEPGLESDEELDAEALTNFGAMSRKTANQAEETPKTRKQIVDEIIAQSKKTKFERQQIHEEAISHTKDLDTQYKNILGLLGRKGEANDGTGQQSTDYDILVNKLKFEARVKPSEKTKSKEEQENERKRKLQQFEEERLKRMKMPTKEEKKVVSVDSITEATTKADKRFEIRFKDGKMIMPEGVSSLLDDKDKQGDHVEDEDSSDDDSGRGDTSADVNYGLLLEVPKDQKELEKAMEDLPLEEKVEYLNNLAKQLTEYTGLDRKTSAQGLFSAVMDYIDALCDMKNLPFNLINQLSGAVFDIAMIVPNHTQSAIKAKLGKYIKRFWKKVQSSGYKSLLPTVKEIMLLKIIALLYPTSDVKHVITTPSLLLMAASISMSCYKSPKDVAIGLLVSTMILEYVSLSKRYVPEVICFLTGVLWLSIRKNTSDSGSRLKVRKSEHNMLVLGSKQEHPCPGIGALVFGAEDAFADSSRLACTTRCLQLVSRFSKMYSSLPSREEIFAPCIAYIERLDKTLYPEAAQTLICTTLQGLREAQNHERTPLTWLARKPIPLPLLEPRFMETYEVRHDKRGGKGKSNEKQKLTYKYKKEYKGAVRELRKDSQFLAKEKLQETIERDQERARKVRELMADLGQQQGEYNALSKIKKKASR